MARETVDGGAGGSAATDRYRHLIEHVQDAVVEFDLVDGEPIVSDVNRAFVDVFGYDADEIRGEPLNEWVVPGWKLAEAEGLDANTASGEINYQRVKRQTADGLREFLYRSVPYREPSEPRDGFAIYTDLTDITRRERQLQVLNRVLRHNLRNKVTVIAGNVTRLQDQLDIEDDDAMRSLSTAADDLRSLTTEATQIQSILEADVTEESTIDVIPVIGEVLVDHRDAHPDAEIAADLPGAAQVKGTTELRTAIASLVQNAIEHNPADVPRVRVSVKSIEGEWIDVVVADDGPRIPESERDVITGAAEITPTRHGSGLGLWLVKWTAERFGGELSFGESDMGGNSVRMRLRATAPE